MSLRRGGARAHSTLRNYQNTIALFCDYLVDPRYEWAKECLERFGTHAVQICHEWKCATRRCCFRMEVRNLFISSSS